MQKIGYVLIVLGFIAGLASAGAGDIEMKSGVDLSNEVFGFGLTGLALAFVGMCIVSRYGRSEV
jgi:hypothetical protein